MTDDLALMVLMMDSPLIGIAVLIGETVALDEHMAAMFADGPVEEVGLAEKRALVGEVLTSATAVWAVRRTATGDLTLLESVDLDAVIADARAYATDHPAELAAFDQDFARFADMLRGAG